MKTCRQKWENLLSMMRAEMKKLPKPTSGAEASNYTSTWKWFKAMLFVAQYQQPNASCGNLDKALRKAEEQAQRSSDVDDDDEGEEDAGQLSDFEDFFIPEEVQAAVEPPRRKAVMPRGDVHFDIVAKKRSESLTASSEPPCRETVMPPTEVISHMGAKQRMESRINSLFELNDELFFEMLLEDTREMTRVQNLHFRNQVMELVLQFTHNKRGHLGNYDKLFII